MPIRAYLISLWSSQRSFYQINTSFFSKMTNSGHQISLGNMTLYLKDMHPLVLEYFPTSLRYIRRNRSASDSVCDFLMVITVSFLSNILSNLNQNVQFWAPDQPGICGAVPLGHAFIAAQVFHIIIRCINMIGSAYISITDPLMVITVSFLPNKTLKI